MSPDQEAPRIPGYRIEAVLGRGATGVVYRARQLSVDRVVALKVLHRELVGARRAEQRLQREARTTARLAHPNIISAIDMGEVGGVWWYAMEIVDGVSLQDRLREGPLSEREALRMFIPLVEALQHAFERGVVHRDIKPGNILVERGGRALLVDLGLAVADDDPLLTKGGGTLGTPHYISPEQARDPRSADVQSDLWSLGATMYHAVCGRPPFAGESVAEILSAVLYSRVADPAQLAPYLSRGFALVLRKCLTRDRARRYSTPAELLVDLERVRERRAPRVARAGLDPVARDGRRVLRAAGFAALVAAGLAGVWLIALTAGRESPVSADAAAAPAAPDPVERIGAAAAGPAKGLAGALAQVNSLERSTALAPEARVRLEEAHQHLVSRIETEVYEFKRAAETDLSRKLSALEFDEAERLATGGLAGNLAARVGSGKLPDPIGPDFDRWVSALADHVRAERERTLTNLAAALERHVKEKVLPRVDELVRQGDWRTARDLLTFAPRAGAEAAGLPLHGLSDADVARVTEPVRTRLEERRAALDKAWSVLDADLRAWVEERVTALRQGLADRTEKDAADRLHTDWETKLSARGLSVDRMPIGVPRLAHEELARGAQTLAESERQVIDEDARLRLAELEEDASPLWKKRLYGEIAQAFESAAAEPWSAALRAKIDLSSREARKLEELLRRAADGVRARDDQAVKLQIRTIAFTGRLLAGADPLADGFRMKPEHGRERAFVLKAPSTAGELLPGAALEEFAGLAHAEAVDPSDRLLLALFRWREGDPGSVESARGAEAALGAGPLPSGEPLLAELERRIAALARVDSPQGERRQRAVEKLRLLRREALESGPREKKLNRIEGVFRFEDVLHPDELAVVRGLRDALVHEGTPSTLAEFQKAFLLPPDRIDLPAGRQRAVLRFDFGAGAPGSFAPGAWGADGIGWVAARYARSDEEMLASPAPKLILRDPLRPQSESLEIHIAFEQPADSPPDLLFVSAAGFHVALVSGKRPRCLVETGEAAEAVAHARAGSGKAFEGLPRGRPYELRLVLNRTAGHAQVDLDGKSIIESLQLTLRGDEKSLDFSVRSFEPVRLLKATVDGVRR